MPGLICEISLCDCHGVHSRAGAVDSSAENETPLKVLWQFAPQGLETIGFCRTYLRAEQAAEKPLLSCDRSQGTTSVVPQVEQEKTGL